MYDLGNPTCVISKLKEKMNQLGMQTVFSIRESANNIIIGDEHDFYTSVIHYAFYDSLDSISGMNIWINGCDIQKEVTNEALNLAE